MAARRAVAISFFAVGYGGLVVACGLSITGNAIEPPTEAGPGIVDAAKQEQEQEQDAELDANEATSPTLTLTLTPFTGTGNTVDLTAAGPVDWAYWPAAGTPVRRAGGSARIGDYQVAGQNVEVAGISDLSTVSYHWTNGTQAAPSGGDPRYLWLDDSTDTIVTVPVDASRPGTASFYVGCFEAECEVEASLSDGSSPAKTNRQTGAQIFAGRYDVGFAATAANATLQLRWRLVMRNTTAGGLAVGAVTLR